MSPALIAAVIFLGMLGIASVLGAFLEGWPALTAKYRLQSRFEGRRHWLSLARMNYGFGTLVVVGANGQGLYLAGSLIFRLGHPPVFIPWSAVRTTPLLTWQRLWDTHVLTFAGTRAQLILRRSLAQELYDDAGIRWSHDDAV